MLHYYIWKLALQMVPNIDGTEGKNHNHEPPKAWCTVYVYSRVPHKQKRSAIR